MANAPIKPFSDRVPESFWVSLKYFNIYRITVVAVFLGTALTYHDELPLGQHSLPVYWVHVELVYGRWMGAWKASLGLGETMMLTALVIAAMVVMAEGKGRYDRGEWPGLRVALGKYWPLGA